MHSRISAIVIAHDRKEYLKKSVSSVLKQSLKRDFYEVIVVKNFEDPDIEQFLNDNRVFSVLCTEIAIGEKISAGLRVAKGDIIALLEDDDIFLQNKLETLLNTFDSNPDISAVFDIPVYKKRNGETIEDFPHLRTTFSGNQEEMNKKPSYVRDLRRSTNVSSTTLRMAILKNYLDIIREVKYLPDSFLFYVALLGGNTVFVPDVVLTNVLIHTGATYSSTTSYRKFINSNCKVVKDKLLDIGLFEVMLRGDPLWHSLEIESANLLLRERIFCLENRRGKKLQSTLIPFMRHNMVGISRRSLLGIAMAMVTVLAPSVSRVLFYLYRMSFMRQIENRGDSPSAENE